MSKIKKYANNTPIFFHSYINCTVCGFLLVAALHGRGPAEPQLP